MTLNYSIPEPKFPRLVYALGGVTILALIALFWSALNAFSLVTDSPAHAAFFAATVEAGAVVEALFLVRARNWRARFIPLIGALAAVIISGTYNFVAVQKTGAANGITDAWQLWVFSCGPLVMMTFLALTTGRELQAHETALEKWQLDKQAFERLSADEQAKRQAAEYAAKLAAEEQARRDELAARHAAEKLAQEREKLANKHAENLEKIRLKFSLKNENNSQNSQPDSQPSRAYANSSDIPNRKAWCDDYVSRTGKSIKTAYRKYAELYPRQK